MEQEMKQSPSDVLGNIYTLEGEEIVLNLSGSGFEFHLGELDPVNGDFAWVVYVILELLSSGYRKLPPLELPKNVSVIKRSPTGVGVNEFSQGYQADVRLKSRPFQLYLAPDIEEG